MAPTIVMVAARNATSSLTRASSNGRAPRTSGRTGDAPEDVRVRHLTGIADFTDSFVLASGASERQVQAVADRVEERLRAAGVRPLDVEGHAAGQWVLLDYADFVVHVFLDERRRFYGLERLWSDAPDVTPDFES